MEDCIFCRMGQGQQKCMKVYEDEHTLALMDIAGDVDGHMLVIPRQHCTCILDCSDEMLTRVMATVKKVAVHLVNNCGYDGVDLMSANGEAAGQSLAHFHVHIIPRRKNDGLGGRGEWPSFPGKTQEIPALHEKLRIK